MSRLMRMLAYRGKRTAALPWYLKGGVAAANCIAAYQPKGAASLAASYTNLANPGTYDAAPGVAPSWDATDGWAFNGTTQYLDSGVTPVNDSSWSLILRYSGLATDDGVIGGMASANSYFFLQPRRGGTELGYWNGGVGVNVAPVLNGGVICFAGTTAYRNGVAETGSITPGGNPFARSVYLGALNAGAAGNLAEVQIQAVAIYQVTLTGPQVAAIVAAMQAL